VTGKPVEVVFTGHQFARLHAHLFQDNGDEQAAYAFATPAETAQGLRLQEHHLVLMEPDDFDIQNGGYLHVSEAAARRITTYTLEEPYSLIEIHSHPFAHDHVGFSSIDTGHAMPRFAWFAERKPRDFHHLMLVFGHDSADGLIFDRDSKAMHPISGVTVLSSPVRRFPITPEVSQNFGDAGVYTERLSRQALAFGAEGQARVARTRVGIVGLGGIGSAIAQQLALLGVRDFVLLDADVLELTNLNRFFGGTHEDAVAGRPKVEIAARVIRGIDPEAKIETIAAHFPTPEAVTALKQVDVLFSCTDTHGSRMLLNAFAVQYMLPYIDLGVGIMTDDRGAITEAGGQFRVMLPDGFCLECIRAIDAMQAQSDLFSTEQRQLHQERGYLPNEDIHAPSVVFLNGTLASMAVGEFLNFLTGFRPAQSIVYYFLQTHQTLALHAERRHDCTVCHPEGRQARGDLEVVMGLEPEIPLDLTTIPSAQHVRQPASDSE
jgi:hypothetical protein